MRGQNRMPTIPKAAKLRRRGGGGARPVRHERPAVLDQLALEGVRRVVRRLEAGPVGGVERLDADGAGPALQPPPHLLTTLFPHGLGGGRRPRRGRPRAVLAPGASITRRGTRAPHGAVLESALGRGAAAAHDRLPRTAAAALHEDAEHEPASPQRHSVPQSGPHHGLTFVGYVKTAPPPHARSRAPGQGGDYAGRPTISHWGVCTDSVTDPGALTISSTSTK